MRKKVQVLLSTMNQTDESILKKMNISTSAIIINQVSSIMHQSIEEKDGILVISLAEKGVGLSRNTALMRSDADIALFADDDVTYYDDYEKKILNAFEKQPNADMIVFNVKSTNSERPAYMIKKSHRIRLHNCLRYGTFRFAVRVDSIKQKNIYFSLMFGGGAKYSSGEDSLFISDCIKRGLKVYGSPLIIGRVSHKKSTWFKGHTEKFFIDKGVFFGTLSPKLGYLLGLQYAVRKYRYFSTKKTLPQIIHLINKGVRITK